MSGWTEETGDAGMTYWRREVEAGTVVELWDDELEDFPPMVELKERNAKLLQLAKTAIEAMGAAATADIRDATLLDQIAVDAQAALWAELRRQVEGLPS